MPIDQFITVIDEELKKANERIQQEAARKAQVVGGKKVTQTGAIFTVALHQRSDGWRIAAWAWTKGKQ